MKIKENLLEILFCLVFVAILVIPFPTVVTKVLWTIDMVFAMEIVVLSFVAIFKKSIPKVYPRFLVLFSIYSLVIYIKALRYIMLFKYKLDDIPLVTKMIENEFPNSPHILSLLFIVCALFTLICILLFVQTKNENLSGSITFFKNLFFTHIILYPASFVICGAVGIDKLGLKYNEVIPFYLATISANSFLYLMPVTMAAVGLTTMMNWIKNNKQ